MRAYVLNDDSTVQLQESPQPQPAPGQKLIKLRTAGICNTDLELMRGYMGFSGIPGHEFVGDILDSDGQTTGRRVVGEINVACGECDLCHAGVRSQCRNRTTVGIDRHDGAFADYMALTDDNLHTVPDSLSDDQAVFTEPLAAALHIMESTHISPDDNVVVIGAGKLGMLSAQAIKLTGADLSVVIRRDKQARLLHKWDIRAVTKDELPANQASVVVDCTGVPGGFADALDLVKPRGTLVLKSTYEGLPEANLTRLVIDEIRLIGSRCGNFRAALDVLEAGLVDVEPLIEARYPFAEVAQAFDHAQQRGVFKVLLDF